MTSRHAPRVVDHAAWRDEVRAALLAAEGKRTAAADSLGVAWSTLRAWLDSEPGLARGIELRGRGRPAK